MPCTLVHVMAALQPVSYLVCAYLQYYLIMPPAGNVPENNPEIFRGLVCFRAVSVSLRDSVHSFLMQEEGKSFYRLAYGYLLRTECLRMGTEDVLGHLCHNNYEPSSILPHLYALRTRYNLMMPQVVRRYYRWFSLVPMCLVPGWASGPLMQEHIHPSCDLQIRFPMISQFPLPSTPRPDVDPQTWPPVPLDGLGWGSSRHVMIIGHVSRYGHLMLPTYAPSGGQAVFFRYATIEGYLLN